MVNQKKLKEITDLMLEKGINPTELLRNTSFKRSELKLDPRVANHWAEKGLFVREYKHGEWLTFNLTEAYWIKTIMKLRDFNVSLDVIKKIKESFFDDQLNIVLTDEDKAKAIETFKSLGMYSKEVEEQITDGSLWKKMLANAKEINDFERIIMEILFGRKPYSILLSQNGNAVLLDESNILLEKDKDYLKEYKEISSKSHIKISLNEILGELVTCLGELTCSEVIPILTKPEAELLNLMRNDKISKVEIRFNKNSEPILIAITTENKVSEQARLQDMIISKGYQDIKITTQNGKIAIIENTKKHKIDTE